MTTKQTYTVEEIRSILNPIYAHYINLFNNGLIDSCQFSVVENIFLKIERDFDELSDKHDTKEI